MPFVADRDLSTMVDLDAVDRACKRITDDAGDRLQANVRRNTPVDASPFRDKPDRPRGALRESIERGRVEATVPDYRVRVFTEDPVAPHVEWDTRPHTIRARRPGGRLHWRDRQTGDHRFAASVEHPGTTGQHMFAAGAARTEAEIEAVAEPAVRQFERELIRGRTTSRRGVA